MKIHSWHLIIGSIILFLLDFLILANKTIFPNQKLEKISTAIALACAPIFVTGIAWAIFEPISKRIKSHPAAVTIPPPTKTSEKSRFILTTLEIIFNRFFAVLLILSAVPLILNPLTIPTIVIFIVFALFLWFGKKYHLTANIIFLIFALGVYFVPIPPIAWGFFRSLKEFRVGGFNFSFPIIFSLSTLLFVSFSVRNILGNIFAYLKTNVSRNVFYLVSLFIVFVIIPAYPLLDSVRLRDRTMNVNTAAGGDLSLVYTQQSLTFIDRYNMAGNFTSKFDSSSKKYIYHLQLLEPLSKDIQFIKVETDGEKINFITDSRVTCLNCQKDTGNPYGLVFPTGKDIDFVIVSDWLIKTINFTEPGDKVDEFIFWK